MEFRWTRGVKVQYERGDGIHHPFLEYLHGYKVVPPQVISWFISPINYRYNPLINPSYSTYEPT